MSYGANNLPLRQRDSSADCLSEPIPDDCRGQPFIPNNFDRNIDTPTIIVGHFMGAMKEQSTNLYAMKLAEQGFVTVSLNLPFWADSEGKPHNAVSPDLYAEAFSAVVNYLGTQDFVNREQISALCICGSGSFVIGAEKIDPVHEGDRDIEHVQHGRYQPQRAIEVTNHRAAQEGYRHGGEVQYTSSTPNEIMVGSPPVIRKFYDF